MRYFKVNKPSAHFVKGELLTIKEVQGMSKAHIDELKPIIGRKPIEINQLHTSRMFGVRFDARA